MQLTTSSPARFVIPPGQEAVIIGMLNPPGGLAAGWRLTGADIRSDAILGSYQGPGGERARLTLRAREDAPPKWRRTERFAIALAAAPSGPAAAALYRSLLAAVCGGEQAFIWHALVGGGTDRPDPAAASRARAAEAEIDLHLDHTPFIDLGIDFDHRTAFAEAMALTERFVAYQSDPSYGITGWRGLALQALDGDPTRAATSEEDAGIYQDQSRYRMTDVAASCPVTMALLEGLLDFANCRTVAFLMLNPGARIAVHVDGVGPAVMRSLNVALNMPEACRLVIDCNADGSDNPYTRTAPFRDGSVLLMNVAKHHYVVNDSAVPRIHVIARGSLRVPTTHVLGLAEAQDGLRGAAAVEAALDVKRRILGGRAPEVDAHAAAAPARAAGGSTDAVLSPYVGRLADAARTSLLAVVGLGDRVVAAQVGPAASGSHDWRGELEVRLPSGRTVQLDFQRALPARPAWFRSANLSCSYRAEGGDPFADPRDAAEVAALCERLNRLDPPPPAAGDASVIALLDALERYRPFLPVKDEDYRIVFHGADHPIGILWFGFRCNQDCRMCWQGRDWPSPPDDMFDRWIEELCGAGVEGLVLSGGEPTLHPQLPRWLRRATDAGVHVTLETNAIRFTEPGVLEQLRTAGLESAMVSLHAADAAVSDALTMAPGTFALTVAGARAALEAGVKVGVHCVVERGNVAGLEAHARFVAAELPAGGRRITHVSYSFPIAYRRREHYRGAIPTLDELRPCLSAAVRVLRAADIEVRVLGTSGFTPCAIDDPTALAPHLPALVSEAMRADRVFLDVCGTCSLQTRCLGIPARYVEAHGAHGVKPVH